MNAPDSKKRSNFTSKIESQQSRKIRARAGKEDCLWFGLGTIGVVGWSVVIPTLIGILIGLRLDAVLGGPISWTITLMFLGLIIGCVNAYLWVKREQQKCRPEK